MLKKIVVLFLSLVFIFCSVIIPDFSSFANVVVSADDSTHYYIYNHIDFTEWSLEDFLTINNYDNYYDSLIGNDKEQISNMFLSNYNNIDVKLSNSLINANYNVDSLNVNASGLFFTPIIYNGNTIDYDSCNKFIGWNTSANQFFTVLFYSPTNDQIVNSSYYALSDNLFILSYTYFGVTEKVIDNVTYLQFHYNGTLQQNAALNQQQNIYYKEFGADYHYFYYDDVCLFTSTYFTQINNPYNAYNLYKQGDTLSIDRRTSNFINKTNGGQTVNPSNYGFKEGSFGNILYGGSYDKQKLMVGYELNEQSKSIQNQLALKLNYRYIFDGTLYSLPIYYDEDYYSNRGGYDIYSLKETNYINIDLSKVFFYMREHDNNYYDNLGTVLDLRENVLVNGGYRNKVVDGSPLYLFDVLKRENILTEYVQNNDYDNTFFESVSVTYKDVTVSPKFNINSIFEGEQSQSYTNTINNVQLIVTESILNLQTNEESTPCTFVYNYIDGSYNYIGTLETSGELFDNLYDYGGQSKNGYTSSDLGYDLTTYGFYPGTVSSQGGNSSSTGNVVNVYPSQYPYILVDIPENEWINKTPNLKNMLTDFKDMLAETQEGSILTLLPATYSYLPEPVWNYILYGVGICVMIGIWHAITRR